MSRMSRVRSSSALLLMVICAGEAAAQTQYFNLDAGRPTRVEDAVPVERYALDVQLAPARVERLDDGSFRWRVEPRLSFGALPFTEVTLRVPYGGVRSRDSSGVRESGVTSIGVGVLRAFNLERTRVPAIAVALDAQLPVGPVSAPKPTYSARVLVTRSGSFGRVHLNVSGGTYSIRVPGADQCLGSEPAGYGCGGFIPDPPCSIVPAAARPGLARAAVCAGSAVASRQAAAVTPPPRTHGVRWLTGIGVDHAFPLRSWLVAADIVAERLEGFQSEADVTAETGVRWQLTPRLVFDAGVARRITGATPASSVTFGLTFGAIVRPRPPVPVAGAGARAGS